jgi:hypothetical protein
MYSHGTGQAQHCIGFVSINTSDHLKNAVTMTFHHALTVNIFIFALIFFALLKLVNSKISFEKFLLLLYDNSFKMIKSLAKLYRYKYKVKIAGSELKVVPMDASTVLIYSDENAVRLAYCASA